jgi:hypothetical protein
MKYVGLPSDKRALSQATATSFAAFTIQYLLIQLPTEYSLS